MIKHYFLGPLLVSFLLYSRSITYPRLANYNHYPNMIRQWMVTIRLLDG